MSINRQYKEFSVTTSGTDGNPAYIANTQLIIQAIVDASDIFTLAEVVTNTSSVYGARLQIFDKPIYLYMYNSGNSIYFRLQALANGSYIDVVGETRYRYAAAPSYGTAHNFTLSAFDDFSIVLTMHCPSSNYAASAAYSWAYAEYLNTNLHMCYSNTGNAIACAIGITASPSTFREDTQQVSTFNLRDPNNEYSYIAPYADITNILIPFAYVGYCSASNSKAYTGRLLWGGKYAAYILWTTSGGAYTAIPERKYVIDGVEYLGCYNRLVLPIDVTQ